MLLLILTGTYIMFNLIVGKHCGQQFVEELIQHQRNSRKTEI
jgi:hypothetical protein